ncbi:MAG: tetratricopeptide repeat protein [Myxococcales bacterium]|nr:tetratricopeptide repeat protein [Myxococcales bacterium]
MRTERTFALVALLSTLALAAEPSAEPSTEEQARAAAAAARAAFDAGDFTIAVARYQEAWRLKPVPGLLFNIGQSFRRSGNPTEALVAFRRYLETGPSEEQVASTEALIQNIEQTQAQVREARTRELKLDETKVALARAEAKNASQRLELELAARRAPPPPEPLLTQRWWFWAGLGVLVAGAATATVVATTAPRPFTPTWPDIDGR